ncbi:MAG: thermonuclease family protein, partial [Actinomycetota bacterium]|nr:thermonuclease family protein [Actinomycetota bacterium]
MPPPSTTLLAPPPTAPEPEAQPLGEGIPDGEGTTVEDVVDGDTIVVSGGTRIRLIGVDTPETKDPRKPVQCFGVEASAYTGSLLASGTPVRLVYDVERLDRYGRTLAYVYRESDGLFVNAALAAGGYAVVATYPPNVAHTEEFITLARQAREAGRGLWSACGDEGTTPGPTVPAGAGTPAPVQGGGGGSGCDASYPDVCIPPGPPDLDCGDIAERRFR